MFIKIVFIVILANFVSFGTSRHVPRYSDLDEDDQMLFRAAYDTPSYDHEEYQDEELPFNKLDLIKDGMWTLKAKMKQMKIFNKALAANLLATKLQIKELIASKKTLKKLPHVEIEKKKPVYSYQNPSSSPTYSHYEPPHYNAPVPVPPQYASPQQAPPKYEPSHQYEPPHQYGSPQQAPPKYGASHQYDPPHSYDPPHQYGSPEQAPPKYEPSHQYEPPHQYGSPQQAPPKYEPSHQYDPPHPYDPPHQYGSPHYEPPHQYEPSQQETHQYEVPYGIPQYGHDPYYGQ